MKLLDGTLLETDELFTTVFINNKKIHVATYMVDDVVYEWSGVYLMSPRTKREYEIYIEYIIKAKPLLFELL